MKTAVDGAEYAGVRRALRRTKQRHRARYGMRVASRPDLLRALVSRPVRRLRVSKRRGRALGDARRNVDRGR